MITTLNTAPFTSDEEFFAWLERQRAEDGSNGRHFTPKALVGELTDLKRRINFLVNQIGEGTMQGMSEDFKGWLTGQLEAMEAIVGRCHEVTTDSYGE